MDIQKLIIDIKLIRILQPLDAIAHETSLKIVEELGNIHRTNESSDNHDWAQFKSETYKQLLAVQQICTEYQDRKKSLIDSFYPETTEVNIDNETTVKFNKRANVLEIFSGGRRVELL